MVVRLANRIRLESAGKNLLIFLYKIGPVQILSDIFAELIYDETEKVASDSID